MKKLLNSKYWWISWLVLLLVVNYLASVFHYRIDFTQEKRYTLSKATKNLLKDLDDFVTIDVFLKGDLKSGVKKLAQSTDELLQDFKDYSNGRLRVRFIDPISEYDDSTASYIIDSLGSMGIQPMTQKAQSKSGAEQSQRIVIPGAVVSYGNNIFPVNLLSGVRNAEENEIYTNAEALLEYKFATAIKSVTTKEKPLWGYVIGNGEPLDNRSRQIGEYLLANYRLNSVDLSTFPYIPGEFNALILAQPTERFSDEQKLKLDQYVLNGGKLLIFMDILDASMDSLKNRNETVAFNKDLNLDDLLFKYGIRINEDLVQDLQSAQIGLVVGMIGDKPQFELIKWPYYPLLSGSLIHPVSKNLDPVFSKFANSIDTVKSEGIRKTPLLTTSVNGRNISTPALISFESVKIADDKRVFNKSYLPVAMLLEGKFSSLYANRLSASKTDSIGKISGRPFLTTGSKEGKIIVVADGDIALNEVEQGRPLEMGYNKYMQYSFANTAFFQNCVEYLSDSTGIIETRAKDFTLRLLDPGKVEDQKSLWQMINIGAPILLVIIFGLIYQALRKRKYQL